MARNEKKNRKQKKEKKGKETTNEKYIKKGNVTNKTKTENMKTK